MGVASTFSFFLDEENSDFQAILISHYLLKKI